MSFFKSTSGQNRTTKLQKGQKKEPEDFASGFCALF
jgi:hypothetical protein